MARRIGSGRRSCSVRHRPDRSRRLRRVLRRATRSTTRARLSTRTVFDDGFGLHVGFGYLVFLAGMILLLIGLIAGDRRWRLGRARRPPASASCRCCSPGSARASGYRLLPSAQRPCDPRRSPGGSRSGRWRRSAGRRTGRRGCLTTSPTYSGWLWWRRRPGTASSRRRRRRASSALGGVAQVVAVVHPDPGVVGAKRHDVAGRRSRRRACPTTRGCRCRLPVAASTSTWWPWRCIGCTAFVSFTIVTSTRSPSPTTNIGTSG